MAKILIIHPEGNIKNNPNLYAVAKLMVQQGYEVLVYSQYRPNIYQGDLFPGARFVYFGTTDKETLNIEKSFKDENIGFIIGIDDFGIWKAWKLSKILSVPFAFLSYEILFDQELAIIGCRQDKKNKQRAKKACKHISFAITQDETRCDLLSVEYGIPKDKIHLMPVANTGACKVNRSDYFHSMFSIPREKHILLYMGWMDQQQERRMIGFTHYLPKDWVIVAHSRYVYHSESNDPCIGDKLFFSLDKPIENIDEMGNLLSGCDVGFCTYQASSDSIYTGDNIRYIGLSSGKTSTFLQYGIPVVVENMNIWDKIVEDKGIGLHMSSSSDFMRLDELLGESIRDKAVAFFDEKLDASRFALPIIEEIGKLMCVSSFSIINYWKYSCILKKDRIFANVRKSVKKVFERIRCK